MNEANLDKSIGVWWNSMLEKEIQDAISIRSNEHILELNEAVNNDSINHSENVSKIDDYIELLKSVMIDFGGTI